MSDKMLPGVGSGGEGELDTKRDVLVGILQRNITNRRYLNLLE